MIGAGQRSKKLRQFSTDGINVGVRNSSVALFKAFAFFSFLERAALDLSFGLDIGGARLSASTAWRQVLETGQVLAPVALPATRNYPVPPVDIRVVG